MVYTIRSGNHYTQNRLPMPILFLRSMSRTIVLDASCTYQSGTIENQYDVNKLFGFSEGLFNDDHQNSARIGWGYSDGALRLYAYVYCNGERLVEEIAAIEQDAPVRATIDATEGVYIFTAGGNVVTLPRKGKGRVYGWRCFPYFGGDEPAPHTVRISLSR